MAASAEAVASNAVKYGGQVLQSFKMKSLTVGKEFTALGIRESSSKVKEANRPPKQLTSNVGKTAGRNSAGRITIWHRGGGAKRLYRRIDLKRSSPCVGVVERIEYDPNRSSRIALVRWVEGEHLRFQKKFKAVERYVPPKKVLEPTTTTGHGLFPLSFLSGEGYRRKIANSPPGQVASYAVVGLDSGISSELKRQWISKSTERKQTCARDVLLSAFSTPRCKREIASFSLGGCLNFPRIAVAGAKPTFFAPQIREKDRGKTTFSLDEIRKWNSQSSIWAHRMKSKAAASWQSLTWQDTSWFVEAADSDETKPDSDNVSLPERDACKPSS